MGAPISRTTLAHRVRAGAATPLPPVTVLGVDDWAWRKGRRYGTILCDLERRRVIDLLPDRSADTLAAWLAQRPDVSVIVRDRAGAYAEGARRGAPAAVQIADRWHLLRNSSDALRVILERHHRDLREAARAAAPPPPLPAPADIGTLESALPPPERPLCSTQLRSCIAQERRDARFAEAKRLREQGMSIRAVACALGVERKTVRRWLRAGQAPTWRRAMGGASILDPHRAYLEDRWRDGCRNAAALWRELCERGFSGQYGVVRDWGTHRRRQDLAANAPNPAGTVKPVKQPEPPTPRRTARLLTDAPEALSDDDRRFVAALRERSPVVAIASDLISRFAVMVKKRTPEGFNGWLREAERTARWRRLRPASGATRTRCALRCASPGAPVRSKGTSTG